MKRITFLIILIPILLLANMIPTLVINEVYVPENDMWCLELKTAILENLDSLYIKTKSDSAFFLTGLEFDSSGIILVDTSSMQDSLNIDKNGDRIAIMYYEMTGVFGASLYFGQEEKYKAPGSGQSLCRDQYADGEVYLDNSPSLGFGNDTLDACCTISGFAKDSTDNPIDSVKLCLNKYYFEFYFPTCRSTAYITTDGSFELRSLAFAFLSVLELTKNQYDTTKIDSLDLSPDSTYDLGTITLKRTQGALPEDQKDFNQFNLSQNYPNPFARETKIVFTLPAELPTLLELYDIQGQKVKTLIKGTISRGKHEITLDGTSLSNGVYIYKLRAGRYSDSKKLIITK